MHIGFLSEEDEIQYFLVTSSWLSYTLVKFAVVQYEFRKGIIAAFSHISIKMSEDNKRSGVVWIL